MIKDFMFDGHLASDYGLLLCTIDSSERVSKDSIISNTSTSYIQPANCDKVFFSNNKYDKQLSKVIEVAKYDFRTCQPVDLEITEIEEIQRWLCRDDGYHDFSFIYDDVQENLIYHVKIDLNLIEIFKRPVGFQLIISTDSPYGYTNDYELNKSLTSQDKTITLYDNSSKVGDSFITMEIKCKESGDYTIINDFDNSVSEIKNCSNNEIITINENLIIESNDSLHDISDDFNYVFPHISNSLIKHKNVFTFNKICDVKIIYRYKRKVGL